MLKLVKFLYLIADAVLFRRHADFLFELYAKVALRYKSQIVGNFQQGII